MCVCVCVCVCWCSYAIKENKPDQTTPFIFNQHRPYSFVDVIFILIKKHSCHILETYSYANK